MIRILAWLSFAFLLVGPQGFAGWKHSALHGACRAETSELPRAHDCEGDGEVGAADCWICTSSILGAADPCDPAIAISFAPPALDQVVLSFALFSSRFSRTSAARAPPLS